MDLGKLLEGLVSLNIVMAVFNVSKCEGLWL
jgi:hypothetical protein